MRQKPETGPPKLHYRLSRNSLQRQVLFSNNDSANCLGGDEGVCPHIEIPITMFDGSLRRSWAYDSESESNQQNGNKSDVMDLSGE